MFLSRLFNKNSAHGESAGFAGLTDSHSHILPGVDDGIKDLSDSLEVLAGFEKLGFSRVWLTPHIMEDVPNTTAHLRERFSLLSESYKGPLELHLASENMIDNLFLERLEKRDFLPIYDNHLLVETSYFTPPLNLMQTLADIKSAGYNPLLAHPERYVYMDMKQYRQIRDMGVKMQLNMLSLSGFYGKTAKDKSFRLARDGFYSVFGSDIHRISQIDHLTKISAVLNRLIHKDCFNYIEY